MLLVVGMKEHGLQENSMATECGSILAEAGKSLYTLLFFKYSFVTCINKIRYEGEWAKDMKEGKGVVRESSLHKNCYWQSDNMSSKVTWPDGRKYEGQWKGDQKSGHGVYSWPDGAIYRGGWLAGRRHGFGEMVWPDGSSYRGIQQPSSIF